MRRWRTRTGCIAAAALLAVVTGCGEEEAADTGSQRLMVGTVNGAGASFPKLLFEEWIDEYNFDQPFVTINYQSIGSGGGIESFIEDKIDFGSSEKYLTGGDLSAAQLNRNCEAVQFPVIFGSVVIAFHDADVDGLILSSELIAKIYDGQITHFDDPEIAALNPDRVLPDREIVPVRRSDGSGTTYVFSHYLDHEVAFWSEKYSEGSDIDWADHTVGADGNEGVTAQVIETPGALGYVNQSYALRHELATAKVINSDGVAIEPTLAATTAASARAKIPESFQFNIDDIGGDGYPIAGSNWVMVYECGYASDTAELIRAFWTWAMTAQEADELALKLGYAPMAPSLKERVLAQIDRVSAE